MDWALRNKEAAWLERMATIIRTIRKWQKPAHVRLMAGEMTAQEMRSVQAVLSAILREIKTVQ